jgi:hypothetical protein
LKRGVVNLVDKPQLKRKVGKRRFARVRTA